MCIFSDVVLLSNLFYLFNLFYNIPYDDFYLYTLFKMRCMNVYTINDRKE